MTYSTNLSSNTSNIVWTTSTSAINYPSNAGGYTYSISPSVTIANDNLTGSSLQVKGDANFEGDVTIKGKSITELIENIEKRLAILHPNEKLEDKWERLKALGNMYRELEAEILEKEKIWDILKK